MFLKRISICGFKSFCDRVDFDFDPGVTCVVGPNGCGKSNVVDAFKWVLGEQSALSLRGRQMSDMIFSGSSTRRSSSVAQVDLVFDNSDRALPLDHQEVTVTRKLFRSGDSEYLLNLQPSRLKDIRELFLDTGVGVDAYSVIEQGKVDGLLKSNPQDRRAIFEEAAGVSRYKARKREAQRKLERTQQNLLRVADVVEELERRLRSVRLQAGKARNYLEYEGRLRQLRSVFAMAEYHRFTAASIELSGEIASMQDRTFGQRTQIDRLEAASSRLVVLCDELAEAINQADGRLVQSRADATANDERIESAVRRMEEQEAHSIRIEARRGAEVSRLDAATHGFAQAQSEEAALSHEVQSIHMQTAALAEQDRTSALEMTKAQADLDEAKASVLELLRRCAQINNEIIRLTAHNESLAQHKQRLELRDARIAEELAIFVTQREEAEARIGDLDWRLNQAGADLSVQREEGVRIDAARQRLVDEIAQLRLRRSAKESRSDLLADLERRREGIGEGVRRVLEFCERQESLANPTAARFERSLGVEVGSPSGRYAGVVGLISDAIEAQAGSAAMVEAVLGEWDQFLVVEDSALFVELLRECGELPGRVEAVCLDRIGPIINERDFSGRSGFEGRLIDCIGFDAAFEELARFLFGKTIVVSHLEVALDMAREDVHGFRFVTRSGEVVESDGRISGGPATSGAGLISRKTERRDLLSQIEDLDVRLAALMQAQEQAQAEASSIEALQQKLRAEILTLNSAKIEASASKDKAAEGIGRLSHERPLITHELAMLAGQMAAADARIHDSQVVLETLQKESNALESACDRIRKRMEEITDNRRELLEELTNARVSSARLAEKRSMISRTAAGLRKEIDDLTASLASADAEREQCHQRRRHAESVVQGGRFAALELQTVIAEYEGNAVSLRSRRDAARLEMESDSHQLRVVRADLSETEALLHERQMELAELTVRRDDLCRRVKDELCVELSTEYEQYAHEERDWRAIEEEIAELRGKMERLGNVNIDAIDELKELEQRYDFLVAQRTDLEDSHRQLTELIEKLNLESIKRFQEIFEQVREHFRAMFRRLFGGGRADIILEDPDDILECGVEIVAQPPGKELQAISLMSGGEKSMTAIALLMSIFQSRPAPFAIMDEVDAALDEANNERFNRIIKEFVSDVQFIIITHSKWTMNAADRLYGITMQDAGVSTRVSVQLTSANVA